MAKLILKPNRKTSPLGVKITASPPTNEEKGPTKVGTEPADIAVSGASAEMPSEFAELCILVLPDTGSDVAADTDDHGAGPRNGPGSRPRRLAWRRKQSK